MRTEKRKEQTRCENILEKTISEIEKKIDKRKEQR